MNASEHALAFALGHSENVGTLTPTTKVVTGTNPAANTEISEVVPVGKLWKLLAVSITLVQGLTQTPLPHLVLLDENDAILGRFPGASAAMAVSTTQQFTWAPGLPLSAPIGATTEVASTAPIPDLLLPEGAQITTETAGIGANSDYAAPVLYVVEYA